jgi:peptide/nickel transport system substrate-binding protein
VSRRRSLKLLGAFAAASLVVAACSSGDDDDGAVGGNATETTAAGTTEAGGTGTTEATETTEATAETTETTTGGTSAALPGAENVGKVGGSACGIPHGPYEDSGEEPAGEVRVAWNDPLLSFNTQTSRGNATANNNVTYLMGLGNGGGFNYYDQDLNFINNDSFGTCTVESLDPLKVTYTMKKGVTWSDGTQIDAADMVLSWAARSTNFNDPNTIVTDTGVTAETDADGNPVVLDATGTPVPFADVQFTDEGALPEGFTYKPAAGVSFDAVDQGQQLIKDFPEISEDGLSATFTYSQYYVDYQLSAPAIGVPAHIVAERALGITDPAQAKTALLDAFKNKDTAALKKISEFWNVGFDATSLPSDKGLYLSAGPYVVTAYNELSELTFDINPMYKWGPKPKVKTVVYRIIGDPTAAVQALQNEEIDIIHPQSTADILSQLTALEDRGVKVANNDEGTYEHVDLVFNNGGPFDPATYGGDAAKALAVRQAFLKTIPRQEIIDRLIKPLNPKAALRNSFSTVPGSPAYDSIIKANGQETEFGKVDIEGAKALLQQAGVTGPINVRLKFAANNPRRSNEFELIRDSAQQAGFTVQDNSSPTWGQELPTNSLYDASLFGWQSTSVAVADSEANFRTDGQNNYGGYSSAEVDKLYDQLKVSTDKDEQTDLLGQIEKHLVDDAFGVTIFQFPGITAWNSNYVSDVSSITLAPSVFWNFWDWTPAS